MGTMIDWNKEYQALPDEELNKIALLRVIECSNGIIQYKFRDGDEDALTIEETREAMKYSMGCMKSMEIHINGEVITFAPETAKLFTEMRRLYISGAKQNNQEDFDEFLKGSKANLLACGKDRILRARDVVFDHLVDKIPPHALDWGLEYIFSFAGWK
jgi:hypothetical protein